MNERTDNGEEQSEESRSIIQGIHEQNEGERLRAGGSPSCRVNRSTRDSELENSTTTVPVCYLSYTRKRRVSNKKFASIPVIAPES